MSIDTIAKVAVPDLFDDTSPAISESV